MLFDTHAHLNDDAFSEDKETIIASIDGDDLIGVLNCGFDGPSSLLAVELSNTHQAFYASVGMHPHDAKLYDSAFQEELYEWLRLPKVVALGEIGLDYYYDHSPRDVQKEVFIKQIQIACEMQKPIIVHSREAVQDTFDMLKNNLVGEKSGVLHSFSQSKEMLFKYLDLDLYISISGVVTFKNASNVRQMVKDIPLDRLLIETDCPYMTPVPFRGKRNEPKYVRYVAERIAEIKEMSYESICEITTQNAYDIFRIKKTQDH